MPRRLLSLIIVSHKWTTKSKLKLTAKTKKVWMNRFRFLKSSNPKNLPINNKRTFRAKRRREICICISRISKTRMIHSWLKANNPTTSPDTPSRVPLEALYIPRTVLSFKSRSKNSMKRGVTIPNKLSKILIPKGKWWTKLPNLKPKSLLCRRRSMSSSRKRRRMRTSWDCSSLCKWTRSPTPKATGAPTSPFPTLRSRRRPKNSRARRKKWTKSICSLTLRCRPPSNPSPKTYSLMHLSHSKKILKVFSLPNKKKKVKLTKIKKNLKVWSKFWIRLNLNNPKIKRRKKNSRRKRAHLLQLPLLLITNFPAHLQTISTSSLAPKTNLISSPIWRTVISRDFRRLRWRVVEILWLKLNLRVRSNNKFLLLSRNNRNKRSTQNNKAQTIICKTSKTSRLKSKKAFKTPKAFKIKPLLSTEWRITTKKSSLRTTFWWFNLTQMWK